MRRLAEHAAVRRMAVGVVGAALVATLVLQRAMVGDALHQFRSLSLLTLGVIAVLGVVDRMIRADVVRMLLPPASLARAGVINEVGTAASKGLPLGGPVATVLRWQIARDRDVGVVGFATMLIATGVATAFVSWSLPLVATLVDLVGRPAEVADIVIVAITATVVVGSVSFWTVALRWSAASMWIAHRSRWLCVRFESVVPGIAEHDQEATVLAIRDELRRVARRPAGLLVRTTVPWLIGAIVLWLALRGVGVGAELGASEFARVYYVTLIIGSFAPTPGGVGVIEAGMTGALVAAGVDPAAALAGVLVYRLVHYVMPITVGTVAFFVWRKRRAAEADRTTRVPVRHVFGAGGAGVRPS